MKVISIFNQKGGVAKTTTSINLASELAIDGKRVLLVDADPQGNATSTFGVEFDKTILDVLISASNIDSISKSVSFEVSPKFKTKADLISKNLKIIPANMDLNDAEIKLNNIENNLYQLNDALLEVEEEYDIVIIDCSPSAGIVTLNALVASEFIIVPFETEFYALDGIKNTDLTFNKIKNTYNEDLEILGYLATKHKTRQNISVTALEVVKQYKVNTFKSVIAMNSEVSKAPALKKPLVLFNDKCRGYKDYQNFSKEVIDKIMEG